MDLQRTSPLTGRTDLHRHRRQQRHRTPTTRALAGWCPSSCSPYATWPGEAAAWSISGDYGVRRLDRRCRHRSTLADAWQGEVDVLINNAGVMRTPERRLPLTDSSCKLGRTTSATSCAICRPSPCDEPSRDRRPALTAVARSLDDLNWQRRRYQRWAAYQQSNWPTCCLRWSYSGG